MPKVEKSQKTQQMDFVEKADHFSIWSKVTKAIVVGIMTQEKISGRASAITRGHYEPEVGDWFSSMKSLEEVVSDDNRTLLYTRYLLSRKPSEENPETYLVR